MTDYSVTESEDAWVLPVSGWRLGRCCIEVGGLSLELLDEDGEQSRANLSRFVFLSPEGHERIAEGGGYGEAGPIVERVGQEVREVLARKDGALRIVFRDGAEIVAPRMDGVEAWEVIGPGKVFVAAPTDDSEPAVWD